MDTLHDRLAELADGAPTGGAPAAELWARGKRVHRLRAAALAATVAVVGVVGAGIGIRLTDGDRDVLRPAGIAGIAQPIEYPVGEELPDLGDTPGPLAAIWLTPRAGGGAPEAVGLVAKTGKFGTLPIDVYYNNGEDPEATPPALSPDGRRIAYDSPTEELIVRDLVSGESYSPMPNLESRRGYTWSDATHLVGHVAGGSDADGWVWEPGAAPKRIDVYEYLGGSYLEPYGGRDFGVFIGGGSPRSCSTPTLYNGTDRFKVPVLCDVLSFISSDVVLGHLRDPDDDNRTVVALEIRAVDSPFKDPALRHVVVTARAPEQVAFATGLIGEALDADGGAS